MKKLAILRHAKSSWDDPDLDDFNRPLNDRGWKAARRIGRELKHRGLHFDLILASTAARVRETIDGVQEKYDFAAPIRFEQAIYLASEGTLMSLVKGLPDTVGSALVVGHNPGLERLVVGLTRDDEEGLRSRAAGKFPTATLALIDLPVDDWAAVAPDSGRITDLILPRELD